jgi:hypothetical protein
MGRREQNMVQRFAVAVDQNYEEFLREWIAKRIWALGDILDEHDQNYMAERRANELTQLATKHGFGDQLARTVQSHGNVLRYVELLYWKANRNAI